ncbi:YneF family protein [Erysipelotrichaceae bacterium OttesenSCG-928-M19]|nr:YneF family protein [Erysipelotrichaceae bacterium OttesenSCG-928-M19]
MILQILTILVSLVVGAFGGYMFSQRRVSKEMAGKTVIDEKTITAIYMDMGRKPSQAQINRAMKTAKANSKSNSKK